MYAIGTNVQWCFDLMISHKTDLCQKCVYLTWLIGESNWGKQCKLLKKSKWHGNSESSVNFWTFWMCFCLWTVFSIYTVFCDFTHLIEILRVESGIWLQIWITINVNNFGIILTLWRKRIEIFFDPLREFNSQTFGNVLVVFWSVNMLAQVRMWIKNVRIFSNVSTFARTKSPLVWTLTV